MKIILVFNSVFDIIKNRINRTWGQEIEISCNKIKWLARGYSFSIVWHIL